LGRHETFIDHAKGSFFITENAWIDPVRGELQIHQSIGLAFYVCTRALNEN
jgi:hypothetical protein